MKIILKDQNGEILYQGEAKIIPEKLGKHYLLENDNLLFDLYINDQGALLHTKEAVELELDLMKDHKATIHTPYGIMETEAGLIQLKDDQEELVLRYWISDPDQQQEFHLFKEGV